MFPHLQADLASLAAALQEGQSDTPCSDTPCHPKSTAVAHSSAAGRGVSFPSPLGTHRQPQGRCPSSPCTKPSRALCTPLLWMAQGLGRYFPVSHAGRMTKSRRSIFSCPVELFHQVTVLYSLKMKFQSSLTFTSIIDGFCPATSRCH